MKKTRLLSIFALIFSVIFALTATAAEESGDPYAFDYPPPGSENPNAGTGEPPLADNPRGEDLLLPAMADKAKSDEGIEQMGSGVSVKNIEATPTAISQNEQMFMGEVPAEKKQQSREEIERDVDLLFKEGKKHYDNEDYEAASEIWARIIVNYPTSRNLYTIRYSLASAYEYSRQYDKAIDQYQKVLGEKPKSDLAIEASYRLAGCYARLSKWQYAIEIYRDIIRKNPTKKETVRAYFNIAAIYFKMEKFKKVSNIYLSIIRNFPNSEWEVQARLQLASTYAQTSRYKSAINEYKMIKYKFKDTEWAPRAAMHIGDTYKLSGDMKNAKEAYSRVVYEYYNKEDYVRMAEQRILDLKRHKEYEHRFYGQ